MHWVLLPLLFVGLLVGALSLLIATRAGSGRPDRWLAAALAFVALNYLGSWLANAFGPGDAGEQLDGLQRIADAAGFIDPLLFLVFAVSLGGPLSRRAKLALAAWCVVVGMIVLWRLFASSEVSFREPDLFVGVGYVANAAAYLLALGLVAAHYERSVLEGGRARLRPVVAGLLVVIPTRVALLPVDLGARDRLPEILVASAATILVVLLILARLRSRLDRAELERAKPYGVAVLVSIALIAAIWIAEGALRLAEASVRLGSLRYGLRWVLFAFIVAFGISREGFLSLDRNVIRGVRWGLPAAAAMTGFVVAQPLLRPAPGHDGAALTAQLVGGLFGLALGAGLAAAQIRGASSQESEARARRVESYRQLIEAAVENGHDPDEPRFRPIRTGLGLAPADHEEVVRLVRAAQETARLRGPEGVLPAGHALEAILPSNETTWVIRARDAAGRQVVVKALRPEWRGHAELRGTFLAEMRLLAELAHPNLVRVLAIDEQRLTAVLEHAPGGTLAQRVRDQGPLPAAELRTLARDALAALAHLHARGWVHRDVKPENVLIDGEGRYLLADLGVAAPAPTGATRVAGLAGRDATGTVAYMSPEQLRNERVGPPTDLYALGATLVFAAVGRHYLGGETLDPFELQRRVLESTPRVPALPADLAPFVEACLAKEPAARPHDAADALARLDGLRHP